MESQDDELVINLTEKDWNNIKTIAMELLDAGQFDRNQFKCTVVATIVYLSEPDEEIKEDRSKATIH